MPRVTFLNVDGSSSITDVPIGTSVMRAAVENMIPGILGDCGGSCACATCHAYIEAPWDARLPARSLDEESTLEGALDVQSTSRLTCQIKLTDELDGLVVRLPLSQV